jgi:hypothetical protein
VVNLLDAILAKVAATNDIKVASLFGSQARRILNREDAADSHSDVDLQIVTSAPESYDTETWFRSIVGHAVVVCANRAVFGGVSKFTVLYGSGELDCVVVPYRKLAAGRIAFRLGLHRHLGFVRRGLVDFADLMRFAHVVVKGGDDWESFYRNVGFYLPPISLDDTKVLQLGRVAYVDAVTILGRIERGELISARRMFHQSIIETNIQLLHEWRERSKLRTYHRGRRAEQIHPAEDLALVAIEGPLDATILRRSTIQAIEGCEGLVERLTGRSPNWPPIDGKRFD